MKRIAMIDVDGVVCDFEGALVKHLEKNGFRDRTRNLYSLEERYEGDVLKEAMAFVRRPSSYTKSLPIVFGVRLVEDLIQEGYSIMFVTSRPRTVLSPTSIWLCNHIPSYGKTMGCWCGVDDKAFFASELGDGLDFVIDDKPETVYSLQENGILALCWSQPWNEGVYPQLGADRDGTVFIREDEEAEDVVFLEMLKRYAQEKETE